MKLKYCLLTVLSIGLGLSSFGQANLLNAKTPEEIGVKSEAQKALDNDRLPTVQC